MAAPPPRRPHGDRPAHPTGKAVILLIAVTLLLVLLAALATF